VRLEVRRVSGHIRNDQVYWDDDNGIHVFNPDGIEVIDDVEQKKPPYIIFEFKFREVPKITQVTQRMTEENADTKIGVVRTQNQSETVQKSSKSGTSESALPAIGRAEGTSSSLMEIQAFQTLSLQ
jgi:hypothetical protein